MFARRTRLPQLAQRMPDIRLIAPFETISNADNALTLMAKLGAITPEQCQKLTGLRFEARRDLNEARTAELLNLLKRYASEAMHFGEIVRAEKQRQSVVNDGELLISKPTTNLN